MISPVPEYASGHRRLGPDCPLAAATATHREPLLPVELEQFLVVSQITLPLEQSKRQAAAVQALKCQGMSASI